MKLPDNCFSVAEGQEQAKRFKVNGYYPTAECPDCGTMGTCNFEMHYLSYPIIGAELEADVCCPNEKCVRWGDPPIATVKFKVHIVVEHLSPDVSVK